MFDVQAGPFWFMTGVIMIDLAFRYFLYGKLDSISIDIAFFATAYNFSALLASLSRNFDALSQMTVAELVHDSRTLLYRLLISCGALIVMLCVHLYYNSRLDRRVEQILAGAEAAAVGDKQIGLRLAKKSLERSAVLTLNGFDWANFVRQGKLQWREQVADFLNWADPAPSGQPPKYNQKDFLLPVGERVFGVILFTVLGAASLFSPFLVVG